MAKMKAFPLGRRIMALFLTALMCVSLVQISAFAAENQTSAQQITAEGGTSYYKADGTKGTGSDYDAAVSKTISGTDAENVFDVNVKVETKKKVTTKTTQTPAHVVLVIDASGSMGGSTDSLTQARKAAKEFADTFLGADSADENMLAMVAFSHGVDKYTHLYGKSGLNNIKNAIDSDEYSAGGGTNTQAGIHAAQEILRNGHADGVKDIILLMSDGFPTYSYLLTGTANIDKKDKKLNFSNVAVTGCDYSNVLGSGSNYTVGHYKFLGNFQKDDNLFLSCTTEHGITIPKLSVRWDGSKITDTANNGTATKWEASQAKASGTEIYSVLLTGNDMDSDDQDIAQDVMRSIASKNDAQHVMTTGDASKLAEIFQKISSSVTEGSDANGTTVTDPMGSSIKLVTDFSKDAYVKNDSGTLTWTLDNKDTGTGRYSESGPDNDKTYTYTLTYQVRLDNTASGFSPNTPYSLGAATLSYTNAGDSKSHAAVSPQPAVKGYLGGFTFQKRASGDETGAQATVLFTTGNHSATFTLYSDNACTKEIQTASTIGNQVTFSGIPSGATYYMKETAAPEGFQTDTNVYTVSVAYGVTTVSLGDQVLYNSQIGSSNAMTIVDKYDPKNVPVTVTKTWQDGGNANRPSVTVNIWKQNGARDDAEQNAGALATFFNSDATDEQVLTLNLESNSVTKDGNVWTLNSGKELPSVDEATGKRITYYATEDAVNGYKSSNVEFSYTPASGIATAATVTATNTRTGTHDITVNKRWVAPQKESQAEIQVLQNNTDYKTVTLNTGNNWTDTLKDVPTYDNTGREYTYSVHEVNETDGTVTYGTGDKATTYSVGYSSSGSYFRVTNTIPQSAVTIIGTKVWKDGNSTSRTPVTMELYADGQATGIIAPVDGKVNPQSYSFSKDGKDDLPKYALTSQVGSAAITEDGHEIVYTVRETTALGGDYKTAEEGTSGNHYVITNQLAGTTSVSVEKKWDVPDGFFGTTTNEKAPETPANAEAQETTANAEAPETTANEKAQETTANAYPSVTLQLYRNDTPTYKTVTLDGKTDEWKYTFSGLDKYDENGYLYTYTVKEQSGNSYTNSGAVTVGGKAMSVTLTGSGTKDAPYVLTNSAVGTTSVTGTKTWVDGGNALNTRPESVTLQLVRDGQDVDGKTVTLTSSNAAADNPNVWYYTFADLPAYHGSAAYAYTVREVSPDSGYDVSYSVDTLNITNTIKQEKVAVYGEKVWVDGDNAQNTRQDAVIHLMNGDKSVDTKPIQKADTGDALKFSFTDLDKFDASGAVIAYTLTEDAVTGYTTSLTQKDDLTANSSTADHPFVITNTYAIPTTQVAVNKTWVDGGKDHSNDSVAVQLLRNGSAVEGKTCALTAAGNWSNTDAFVNLPTLSSDYKTAYTYTVEETGISPIDSEKPSSKLSDYTVTYNGGAITNTLAAIETEKTNFEVYKNWIGPAPKEVSSVTAVLGRKANDTEDSWTTNVTVSKQADGSWSGKAADLNALNKAGYPYTYFIKAEQGAVTADNQTTYTAGGHTYDVNIDGHTITNTIQQEKVTVQGTKSWTGDTSEKSVQVQLTLGDQKIGDTLTVSKDTDWKYMWKDLDAYTFVKDADGKVTSATTNDYRVEEVGAKSNGDGTAAVQYGNNHYTVKYTTGKDGSQNIENTWTSTDTYAYQIDRVYHHYQDGTLNNTINKAGTAVSTAKNDSVSVDTVSYPATDSMTGYTLVGATLKKNTADAAAETQTVGKDGKFSFNVTDPNVTYVVTLTYESRQTTPYTPPVDPVNPSPNPPVVIPNQPTPGDEKPTEPPVKIPDVNPPTTDIPDGKTPTAEKPAAKIPEGKTPLASAPRTGDSLAAWLTAAIASGAGLAWLAISAKKRREENAQ